MTQHTTSDHFADRLLAACRDKGSPICVGIDPILDMLPPELRSRAADNETDSEAAVDAIFDFTIQVLRTVAPHVPCVKFQSAYFEQFRAEGVEAYYSLVHEASEMGLVVIGDVKRGDIGSTASAYAAGHLVQPSFEEMEDVVTPDAITVNPFLGMDTLQPFIDAAQAYGKGLFVLVRTSNPGSAQLQDAKMADGRTFSEMLADTLAPLVDQHVGASGYSAIGAVVGATQPQTMESLRKRLPRSLFLLPGYGAQGATAEMTRAAFTGGEGALVSASRSILYAHREPRYAALLSNGYQRCIQQAVIDMKEDVRRVIQA